MLKLTTSTFAWTGLGLFLWSAAVAAQQPWINEIHYDNASTDEGEFLEIAGPAGLDLTGYTVIGYNGSDGGEYDSISLSGTIPDFGNCLGAIAFDFIPMQNGAPDGLALVDPSNTVVEFISYEGEITATEGPANGTTSVDIGVAEGSSTPIGFSLQLGGTGTARADFSWQAEQAATRGAANTGQTFADACTPSGPSIPDVPVGAPLEWYWVGLAMLALGVWHCVRGLRVSEVK